jgi:hypothetical protein
MTDELLPMLPSRVEMTDRAVWQTVGDEVILLSLEKGHYFTLDDVGSRMWDALLKSPDVESARLSLLEQFDVDEPTLQRDLVELIDKLSAAGVLTTSS